MREPLRHCSLVLPAASCCPTLVKPFPVPLQVVASSLGDSRGGQHRQLVSRWASHWVSWILDPADPSCCMAWCRLAGQQPDVRWSVAAHSSMFAVLIAQRVALPSLLLKGSHMRNCRHLTGRHLLPVGNPPG